MDSLIDCHCGHRLTHHVASGCEAISCACRHSAEDILELELAAARAEYLETYRRFAEPEPRERA